MNRWYAAYRRDHITVAALPRGGATFGLLVALVLALTVFAPPAAATGKVRKQADFNGDGYADLAVGAPGEDYWFYTYNAVDAGVVHVVYGGAGGLAYGRNSLLSRANEAATGLYRPANYQRFGAALAWGDFNKDGYDDLAIGVPGDRTWGSVDIYFGSASGLGYRANQRITQAQIPDAPPNYSGNGFGTALATGDVDGDGYADLAISQNFGAAQRGAAYVVRGSSTGLMPRTAQMLYYFPWLGPSSMAMGDFNGDGHDDLAMGTPLHWKGDIYYAGLVLVAFGTPYGLDSNPQVWDQDSPGVHGVCENGDQFGYSLVAADFNDDGKCDLAIGAPGENNNSGVVHVLFGQAEGLSSWANQIWSQDSPDVYDVPETNDRFGESLAAMHLEYDRFPELIVGIPGENSGAGGVQTLTIIQGYLGVRNVFWNQDSYEVQGGTEPNDRFGSALSVGDFNGNGTADLAIGAMGENTGGGAVNVLFGAGSGLSWRGNQLLMQGYQGLQETQENSDSFGRL
jgi:hypothetical protein